MTWGFDEAEAKHMNKFTSPEYGERLKDMFDEMVVYKDLQESSFINAFKLPSFMRDWVMKKFQEEDGSIDHEATADYIKRYIPKQEDWKSIKNRVVNENERVSFLAKVSVDIDIKTQQVSFDLPDFNLSHKDTAIPEGTWQQCSEALLKADENWGVVELGYQPPLGKSQPGKIILTGFKDFRPYRIDLDEFREAAHQFKMEEWIDIVLGAIDYNPAGYMDIGQKLAMLTRLLPFVEKRLNLIELAPKGTGKSYLFGSVSRYGWLSSGGIMSRARMFYNLGKRTDGLVVGHDFVALDEVQTISFTDVDEIRGALKGYMEKGKCTVGEKEVVSDAGIVLLGNIRSELMTADMRENVFQELPEVFKESALIDRFHGFLRGWDLPRMTEDLKVKGWALNSEFFSTVMHEMREDPVYRTVVDQWVIVPEGADTRDTEAIKRIATGFLKLIFPYVRKPGDITDIEFKTYCLSPACRMRDTIRYQLGLLDSEYRGKSIPALEVRNIEN